MSLQTPVLQITVVEPQTKFQARRKARWAIFAAFASLIVALIAVRAVTIGIEHMDKRGAGLLLVSDNRVLLLLRRSSHNDNTWGLPGGNVEPQDASLEATALREATEELGVLPPHSIRGSILTKRGKFNNKQYTVFVAELSAAQAATYKPVLNYEHREWRWFPASVAAALPNLHPVVDLLFSPALRSQVDGVMPGLGAALGGLPTVPQEGSDKEPGAQLANAAPVVREVDRHGDPEVSSSLQPQGAVGTRGTDPQPLAGTGAVQSGGSTATVKAVGTTEEDVAVPSKASAPASVEGSLTGTLSPVQSPTKSGAGFIFLAGQQVLLLQRQSKHHDGLWALPGGNKEPGETGGLDTAQREALEELGSLPAFKGLGQFSFRWGKNARKEFTAVVAAVNETVKQTYEPQLNKEHASWRWVPLEDAGTLPLHPVVQEALLGPASSELKRILATPH